MSYKNSFEPSARTAELQKNTIGNADLEDALIGQALSIFQGSRQSRLSDNAQLPTSGDQHLPSVVRNQRNSIADILNGPCDQAQTVRNSGKFDIANGVKNQLPEVRRNENGSSSVISRTGELINGILSNPVQMPTETIRSGKGDRAILPSTADRINDLINNIDDALPSVRRNDKVDRATIPNNIDGKGMIGPNGEIPPVVPNTLKDSLREFQKNLNGPGEIILCTYHLPPRENRSIKDWLSPNGPSDVVLCSAKTPITGQKPGPDNYYACVYYYPLKIKDGVIQIQRQSD